MSMKPMAPHGMRTMGMKTPRSGIRSPRIANLPNPSAMGAAPAPGGAIAPTASQVPGVFPPNGFPKIAFTGKKGSGGGLS